MRQEITYGQALFFTRILFAIPLSKNGRELTPDTAASVMMARVGWGAVAEAFEKRILDTLKQTKENGYNDFDEHARAIADMEDVDRRVRAHNEWNGEGGQPPMPTEEEIAAAEKTRETEADFRAEEKRLTEIVIATRAKELEKTMTERPPMLTRADLAGIIGMFGIEGKVTVGGIGEDGKPGEISNGEFFTFLAANLVEQ